MLLLLFNCYKYALQWKDKLSSSGMSLSNHSYQRFGYVDED